MAAGGIGEDLAFDYLDAVRPQGIPQRLVDIRTGLLLIVIAEHGVGRRLQACQRSKQFL
ncbi:hypothetical protein D3C81_2328270 [compost metagenome]